LVLYFLHLFLKCDAAFHWPTAFFFSSYFTPFGEDGK
jgi:hypothetical protein